MLFRPSPALDRALTLLGFCTTYIQSGLNKLLGFPGAFLLIALWGRAPGQTA